jgi:hypothetical protein
MRSRIGAALLFVGISIGWSVGDAQAQPGPGSQYPNPRLNTVSPHGGKVGTSFEVTFTGTDLDEPQSMVFSTPGIKAEAVLPPPPPPPDPKKPKPPPMPKPQVTKFKVTIAGDAPLGNHDVRLVSRFGVSNPRAFVVGDLTEVMEKEPNNDVAEAQRVELNTTINGAITTPTDVDYFVFAGKKDQRVVVSCLASTIDSRLFAGLEVYDSKGKQLAASRNYQGNDALADVSLPADGDYYVRLYEYTHTQGTPEHYYRLTISVAPWIDAVHPCVIQPGKATEVTVYGRNLPNGKPDPSAKVDGRTLEKITMTITPPNDAARLQRLEYNGLIEPRMGFLNGYELRVKNGAGTSNPFLLTYARAPVVLSNGENTSAEKAQEIAVPCEVSGRIDKRRARDYYVFNAKKGDIFNIEVLSHRLGASTDMRLVLHNVAAKADIVDLDDNPNALSPKFLNRTEDPPVYRFTVPADGKYRLMVMCMHGDAVAGPRQFYRVRITPDQPDFHLVVMPSANNRQDSAQLLAGSNQYYTVFAERDDGWNGPIQLTVDGLPKGVTCAPLTLQANARTGSLILSGAADAAPFAGEIKVKGTAVVNGANVVREARSASIVWPVPAQQGVPTITRLDRGIFLAVREKAPFNLTATLDKPTVMQGDKATINLKLARLSPDFKNPLIVTLLEPVPNVVINNNQPFTIAAGKDDGALAVVVNAGTAPGTYQVAFRCQGQLPFNRDPMAKQKPNINVMLPSAPLTITVLPKQVGTLALAPPNPMVKVGGSTEVVVKVSRMYEFAGEFKIQLVLPANAKGISADPVTIAAGQNEVKLVLKAAADAASGAINDLIVRAVATVNGNVTLTHDLKFAVNVVK